MIRAEVQGGGGTSCLLHPCTSTPVHLSSLAHLLRTETVLAEYDLPYGKTQLHFSLPDSLSVQLLAPHDAAGAVDRDGGCGAGARRAARPIVGRALARRPSDGGSAGVHASGPSVAIAINDKTRPVPHKYLLPPLLARLEGLGIQPEQITLIIATGTHPPMQPGEFGMVIPQGILGRYPAISHDAEDSATWSTWARRHGARRCGLTAATSKPICASSSATSSRTSSRVSPAGSRAQPSAWPASPR